MCEENDSKQKLACICDLLVIFFLSNNKIAWLKDRTPDIGVRVICGGKLDTSTASVENSCFIMSIVLPLTKNNEISCAFLVPFYLKK